MSSTWPEFSDGAQQVNEFHKQDDVDSSWHAHHHTLGTKANQAAAGNHKHLSLLSEETLTGDTAGNVALQNLITLLADAFGFADGTT